MFLRSACSLFFAALFLLTLSVPVATAQFATPYLAADEIERSTGVATDSIGAEARLVGIATTGEIDLSESGFPIVLDGFDAADGTSSAWGYLFTDATGDEQIGVGVVRFAIGDPFILADREGEFENGFVALDMSGEFAGSERFAAQVVADDVYKAHRADYPEMLADAIVFAWNPDGADEFLPDGFPRDLPIWSIFFSPDALTDSSMVCFVASGTGQTVCLRFSTTGVDSDEHGQSGMSLATNPVDRSAGHDLRGTIELRTESEVSFGLYSLDGRKIRGNREFVTEFAGLDRVGSFALLVDGIAAGRYVVVCRDEIGSRSVIVEVR